MSRKSLALRTANTKANQGWRFPKSWSSRTTQMMLDSLMQLGTVVTISLRANLIWWMPNITNSTSTKTSAPMNKLCWNHSVNWTRTRKTKSREPGCQSTQLMIKSEIYMVSSAGPPTLTLSIQKITTKIITITVSFSIPHATMRASSTIKTWQMLNSLEKMLRNSQSRASPSLESRNSRKRNSQWAPLS